MDPTPDHPAIAAPFAPPGTSCVGCGYGLDRMAADGRCPECATPVADSLEGDLLANADPEYLASLARGINLVIAGSLVAISWWFVTPILQAGFVQAGRMSAGAAWVTIQSVDFAAALLLLLGWWQLSSPNPAVVDPTRDLATRRVLRWLLLLIAGISAIGFVGVFVPAFAQAGLVGVSGNITITAGTHIAPLLIVAIVLRFIIVFARAARFFVGLSLLATLVSRVPDPTLAKQLQRQMWVFPLWMTLGWAIVVGPIIGIVGYMMALVRARRAIVRTLAAARKRRSLQLTAGRSAPASG